MDQALGQLDAADGALGVVLLEAGARQVAADDALCREHLGLLDQHEAAGQIVGERLELLREVLDVCGDQVVLDARLLEQVKPEQGDAGEDLALVGDLVFEDVVEGGDAV